MEQETQISVRNPRMAAIRIVVYTAELYAIRKIMSTNEHIMVQAIRRSWRW
jgi:hypothetical protein